VYVISGFKYSEPWRIDFDGTTKGRFDITQILNLYNFPSDIIKEIDASTLLL